MLEGEEETFLKRNMKEVTVFPKDFILSTHPYSTLVG